MKVILLKFKLELLLLIVGTLTIVGFFIITLVKTQPTVPPPPSPSPQSEKQPALVPKGIIDESNFSPFFDSELGTTTEAELKNSGLREIPTNKPGSSEFVSDSAFSYRDNSIITEDSVAAFKRIIPINPQTWESPQITFYEQLYGSPESKYKGSVTYGDFMETYIYASRGVAVIFNPFTSEVFEVQSFLPTTVEEYLKKWGSDITDFVDKPPGP